MYKLSTRPHKSRHKTQERSRQVRKHRTQHAAGRRACGHTHEPGQPKMPAARVESGPSPTYLSITSLVCSEITGVTTQLRLDARSSVSYLGSSAVIPRLQRGFKRAREVALHYGPGRDCMEYLEPFLETIRCEETSGVVTQRALSAVHAFLRAELLSLNPASAPAAMVAVVKAATFCRFEVTDPAADEVVLMCILQLLVGCIECNAGGLHLATSKLACFQASPVARRVPRRARPSRAPSPHSRRCLSASPCDCVQVLCSPTKPSARSSTRVSASPLNPACRSSSATQPRVGCGASYMSSSPGCAADL